MSVEKIIFYCFAALMLVAAAMVITSRQPVRAVLFLVLAFVSASGLWLLLEAEFLAIILVLVYVGAVMVLFLFVVMMLNLNTAPLTQGFIRYLPLGILIGVLFIGQVIWLFVHDKAIIPEFAALPRQGLDYNNTKELGLALYQHYLYPFEIAGVILLVAIVAAIALTYRGAKNSRKQNVSEQVKVTKADRLTIVKDK
ncbi:MAG: NADH-quinone oxidoreductase subunit J [Legionellales bacterium]|jgi:NADH-quinone oxidoreductase subunit J